MCGLVGDRLILDQMVLPQSMVVFVTVSAHVRPFIQPTFNMNTMQRNAEEQEEQLNN